jgi:hypothetical protein
MTLYRELIVDSVVSALIAANTPAGENVFAERDWPVTPVQMPSIMVKAPAERKESNVRGASRFTSTATIVVLVRASGATSAAVSASLATLCGQIEQAILTDGSAVQNMVQQFTSVDTETRTSSEASTPIGESAISILAEYFEEFQVSPSAGVPLQQIGLQISQIGTDAPAILAGSNIESPGAPITSEP